jgi:branched-chain amino acid transport system permease protein
MKTLAWSLGAIAVLALILVPLHINGYWLNLLYQTVLFVGLAYGWNIISGYAGYFSFGQIAFFGIGAYTTGVVVLTFHQNWLLGAVLGGVVSALLALPVGAIMLRLRGPFFSLGMLGLAQTARVLISSSPSLGGGSGLFLPPGSSVLPVYYWTLAIALAAFAITWWISRSAFGLRLQAIREDEAIAGTLGVDATRAKVTAFVISAAIPGLLGGGYAWFLTYIEPTSAFSGRIDLQSIVMAILGGVGTVWGPLIGGVLMTQVSEALWANFPQAYLMIFGGLLVALLILLPRGIVPALASRMPPRRPAGAVAERAQQTMTTGRPAANAE